MNKKLAILLLAVTTVSTTMFGDGFFEGLGRGVGRTTKSITSIPEDIATDGETREERNARWREQDMDRQQREENRYQERRRRESNQRYYAN